jgi:hypothetical protein
MKTLQEQYTLIQEGKGHKDMFLKSAHRLFPEYITNFASYGEATTILKQKGILNEVFVGGGVVTQRTFNPFKAWDAFLNEEYTVAGGVGKTYASQQENPIKAPKPFSALDTKAVNDKLSKEVVDNQKETGFDYSDKNIIDNVYGEEFLQGYYAEMKDPKNTDKTIDELKEIVRKNLAKNSSFYVENAAFGIKGIGYTKDAAGLGEGEPAKGKYKASGYGDLPKKK